MTFFRAYCATFNKLAIRLSTTIKIFIIPLLIIVLQPESNANTNQILELNPKRERYNIGQFLGIFEDDNNENTIEQVSSQQFSDNFRSSKKDLINLHLTNSTIWLRFTLYEPKFSYDREFFDIDWVLDTGRFYLDQIELFIPASTETSKENKNRWILIKAGSYKTDDTIRISKKTLFFKLPISLDTPKTFYLRIKHSGPLYLPLKIYSTDSFLIASKKRMLLLGVYYGIIVALLLINLFAFFWLRDNSYLIYILYIGSVALYFLCMNGIAFEYLVSGNIRLHKPVNLISFCLTCFWALLFAKIFLMTDKYSPYVNKLLLIFIFFALILLIMIPFVSYNTFNKIGSIFGMIVPVLAISVGIFSLFKGFRPARFYVIAWSFLTLGAIIYSLTYSGILPYSALTWNSFQIGSAMEAIFLSFALADRIRMSRRERAKIMNSFGKYVTREVRDQILDGRIPLDGEIKEVTVIFADLRDFTTLTESTPPKDVVMILNEYFSAMAIAIRQNSGAILRYVGDEIYAAFGAPLSLDYHQRHAVEAALEMNRRLISVNDKLIKQGYSPLKHGIGIHTGIVVAANIGGPDRLSYDLVGDAVNLASRIQDLTKKYNTDILISHSTRVALDSDFLVEKLPNAKVKGKMEPVEIYKFA